MPTNLYGPRDNFELESSHVLPALIHRFHSAKIANANEVQIWGDGTPLREFLFVEDLARACLMLLEKYDENIAINIGSGDEISILELSKLIARIVGFQGQINCDSSHPNGTPRKLVDCSKISKLGWSSLVSLEDGILKTYNWFLENDAKVGVK